MMHNEHGYHQYSSGVALQKIKPIAVHELGGAGSLGVTRVGALLDLELEVQV